MVEVTKDYRFDGPDGQVGLLDLFEGRPQLIIYHFMFDPSWDDGCPSCTAGHRRDLPGFLDHLHTPRHHLRDGVARAAREARALEGGARLDMPWYSSGDSDFNCDFGVTVDSPADRHLQLPHARRVRGLR